MQQPLVDLFERIGRRHRDQKVAPGKADQPLDAALLVTRTRVAEACVEVVIGTKAGKGLLLDAGLALQDLAYGTGQIVKDQPGENATIEGEAAHQSVEEGLLALAGVESHKRLAGAFRAHAEELGPHRLALKHHRGGSPIGLGFLAEFGLQRQKRLVRRRA